jgi:hypothetical protein
MIKTSVSSLEELPEPLRGEYKPGEGGKFYADLEVVDGKIDHPAVAALVRSKKLEAENRGKAEAKAKELGDKLDAMKIEMEASLKNVIPKENADRLEASYKATMAEKIAAIEGELKGEIGTLSESLREVLVDSVAQKISTELAGENADLLRPHVLPRLAVERVDGKAVTRILDQDGKPSAATLEDLKKELLSTKKFAPILIGSKATGGSAHGGSGGGSAPQKPGLNDPPEKWAAWHKAKRTGG